VQPIDRWRKWTPQAKNICDSPEMELTKPTEPPFVSSGSSCSEQTPRFQEEPVHDPAAREDDFRTWFQSSCVLDSRWSSAMGPLHVNFAEWCIDRDAVPCTRSTFDALLVRAGFVIDAYAMVPGITLREDWEANTAESTPSRSKDGARIAASACIHQRELNQNGGHKC
jgi:hypothetical protein